MGFLSRLLGSRHEATGLAGLPSTAKAAPERRPPPRLELRIGDTVTIAGVVGTVVACVSNPEYGLADARLSVEERSYWLNQTAYYDGAGLALWRVRDDIPDADAEPLLVDGVAYEETGGEVDDATWEGPAGVTRTGTWFVGCLRAIGSVYDEDAPFVPDPVRTASFGPDGEGEGDQIEVMVSQMVPLADVIVDRA